MVTIIVNPTKHQSTLQLIMSAFSKIYNTDHLTHFIMHTQEYHKPHKTHEYIILIDDTVKIEGNYLFLMNNIICTVIDLTKESPFKIDTATRE